ncbi:hypothetical protein M2103_002440 [Ereboglobus sp. PH5-5]|uniref:hypothetical protein n=1 Tax=Ereboglobus sp. PH5-5 TaxID=2940529 RepID=UPI0024070416|nr:hypothetical protein [Ereboglobus sp. PH5-5]MDF9834198.1 hypothetical protein [Ereboglobus sp. PH5-5]
MKTVNKLAVVPGLALGGAVVSSFASGVEATDPGACIVSYRSHKPEFPAPEATKVLLPVRFTTASDNWARRLASH